ncbi:MAG: ABC transporter permease [Arcobacter sp.]|nr:ABC transporter permease [Arcobacter sp.]
MFFRIVKQSFSQGRKQKLLAIFTILLSSSLITALLNTSIDVGDKMAGELKSYGANINVIPKGQAMSMEIDGVDYNPLKGKIFLEEKYLANIKDIFWRNNIVSFAPFLSKKVALKNYDNEQVLLKGTYFYRNVPIPDQDDYMTGVRDIFNYWNIKGKMPKDKTNEVLVGKNIAKKLNIKIGDEIKIKDKSLKTVGILDSGSGEDEQIISSLEVAQDIFNLKGKIASIRVSALTVPEDDLSRKSRRNPDALNSLEYDSWYCTAYVSSIAYQIEENYPNSAVKPIWQVAASEGVIINKIQLLMAVVTLAAIFASAMGISSLMGTTIIERAKEVGLIKALGATLWEVYLLFLTEAAIIGLIGGVLGFLFGCLLSQFISYSIFSSFVSVHWIVLPVVLMMSVLISLLGSIIPSRMIAKLLPVEVLYGRK